MRSQDPEDSIRPGFVILLVGALVALLIPFWLLARPGHTVKVKTTVAAPEPPVEAREPAAPRTPPAVWHRVTTPPRGAAVSVRAITQKPAKLPPPPLAATAPGLEERWGIRVHSARLSMGNAFVDLRYEIVDPDKAALLANGKTRAYILDRSSGRKFVMPVPPKEGCFPPTGNRLTTGKMYFAVVGNTQGVLKSGSSVSLVVGDSLATNVTID